MLWGLRNIAFRASEHCFWSLGALLLESRSIAFGAWELCFWSLGAMLLEPESNAFRVRGLCVSCLGVMLFDVASIFRLAKVVLLHYFFDFNS